MSGRLVILDTDWYSLAVPGSGAAAIDLIEAKLAATQFAFVQSCLIMQHSYEAITKLEQVKVALKRGSGSYASGSGGQSALVKKGNTNDAAHGLTTATSFNDTPATASTGTLETLMPGVFNISAGEWERTYIPELRWSLGPSEGCIVSLDEALGETMTIRAILQLEVFG